jgi:ABC-2 type transport system ATP-binding protein
MSAISFRKVAKRYGATQALADLSLDVREGEMFGLIGPDGAGKTTAIRLMCGLLHADAGELRVLGLDPVKDHHGITERVGYLSQRFSLYGDLTIDENIGFFAEVHGVRDYHRRREQLLSMTQLTPFRDRLADRLSGGMKQKLALACTLVHEPHLILLDEPTTGVDPISRREFWKLLSEFLAHGITILMSTPYLDEAERCSRVALLHEGRVLAMDEPARLRGLITGRMLEVIAPGRKAADILRRMPGRWWSQSRPACLLRDLPRFN